MVVWIWKRWQRRALRNAMRGYRKLTNQGKHGAVNSLSGMLATAPLSIEPKAFSPLIYGAALPVAELATRQLLYLRFGLYTITGPIFALTGRAGSKLVYPLPADWIRLLRKEGLNVDGLASRMLWLAVIVAFWAYGCVTIGKLVFKTTTDRMTCSRHPGEFAHFEYIGEAQTPRPGPDGQSYDLITWYRSWPGRDHAVQNFSFRTRTKAKLALDERVLPSQLPMATAIAPWGFIRFCVWAIAASALCLLDIARGRWWHALMLHEAALARYLSLAKPEAVARDYLFNNSGWFQRPLWTYEAEWRGSRIIFYHYSTNSAQLKEGSSYPPENRSWAISNWPVHLVWDEGQDRFVQRAVGRPTRTEIVGPIWFASSPETLPPKSGLSLAVFDVTPFRPSKAPSLALAHNYYAPSTCNAFVRDIARASKGTGLRMIWKRKRNIGKAAHPTYRAMADEIDAQQLAEIILADHSPIRVIKAADAVISMPFTSTAHLARYLGKPSCYYDPTGLVQKDDRGAHDIPILHGYDELEMWIRSVQTEMKIMYGI